MKAAIQKEILLVVHPATYFLMVLGALALVPSWMYGVIFIYGILVAFFNSLNAREMHDLEYSFALPLSRFQMVKARVVTMMGIQAIMLAIMLLFVLLRIPLGINDIESPAGMVGCAANLYLVGFGFATYGLFNLVFYPLYYKDTMKVGAPFIIACIPAFVCIFAIEALPYFPVRALTLLGIPGFNDPLWQVGVLLAGIALFLVGGYLACRLSSSFWKWKRITR